MKDVKLNAMEIQALLEALAEKECITSAHAPGQICAPCEARRRLKKQKGGEIREVKDIWGNAI